MPCGQAGGAERAVLLLGVLEDDDLNADVERHDRVAHARCRRFAVALAFGAGCAHDVLFHALAYTPASPRLQPRRSEAYFTSTSSIASRLCASILAARGPADRW